VTGVQTCALPIWFLGTPPIHGAYQEYLSYPVDSLFPLPASISDAEGALLEPLTIGWHSVALSHLLPGEDIAVFGFGPIGICTLKAALLHSPGRIFITDVIPERLDYARKNYKNAIVINAYENDPVEIIKEKTDGRGVDATFECAGALDTIRHFIAAAAVGGRAVWTGIPSEDVVTLDPHLARRKELTIQCVRRARHAYPKCIDAVASGKITLKDMATHSFKLKDIVKAFDVVEQYRDGVIKAVITL
jgi:threonine dehydrogenase-like Zn-dependent dehydrogenase